MMGMPEIVICRFQVRSDAVDPFVALLKDHWPTLRRLDLVTDFPPLQLRSSEDGGPVVVEIFEWKDRDAARAAHEHPEVAAIWERMGALLEDRGSRRKWEFPHYVRIS